MPQIKISAASDEVPVSDDPTPEQAGKIATLTAEERRDALHRAQLFAESELTKQECIRVLVERADQKAGMLRAVTYLQNLKPQAVKLPTARELYTQKLAEAQLLVERGIIDNFVLDEENKRVFELLCLYFSNDLDFERQGYRLDKNLILAGFVGTGKTVLMKIFATNPRQSYSLVRCLDIVKEFSYAGSAGGWEKIDRYTKPSAISVFANPYQQPHRVWCYDDLGAEQRTARYGTPANVMQDILMECLDTGIPFLATTNLSVDELFSLYPEPRLVSRLRGTNIIAMKGSDRRK